MSAAKLLLLPLFFHVLMTMLISVSLLNARIASLRSGRAKMEAAAVDAWAWPSRVRIIGNNFSNQFETPMFWYSVSALFVATGIADLPAAIMSWLFFVSRLAHHVIHTGKNNLRMRFAAFATGFAIVGLMWLWFGFKFFVAG